MNGRKPEIYWAGHAEGVLPALSCPRSFSGSPVSQRRDLPPPAAESLVTFCRPNAPYEETLLQPVYLDQIPAIPLTGCVLQLSGLCFLFWKLRWLIVHLLQELVVKIETRKEFYCIALGVCNGR